MNEPYNACISNSLWFWSIFPFPLHWTASSSTNETQKWPHKNSTLAHRGDAWYAITSCDKPCDEPPDACDKLKTIARPRTDKKTDVTRATPQNVSPWRCLVVTGCSSYRSAISQRSCCICVVVRCCRGLSGILRSASDGEMRNVVLPDIPTAKRIEQLAIGKKAEKKRMLAFKRRFNENRKINKWYLLFYLRFS